MSIKNTYAKNTDGTLVATEGSAFSPVTSVLTSPVDLFTEEAKNTYITKQRGAAQSLIGAAVGFGVAEVWEHFRFKAGKAPLLSGVLN